MSKITMLFFLPCLLAAGIKVSAKDKMMESHRTIFLKSPTEDLRYRIFDEVIFKDSTGVNVSLSALKGQVVFLNFWAIWCGPCVQEMPSIQKLYNQLKTDKNVKFLMVDMDGDLKKSLKFMQRKQYNMPVVIPASELPSALVGAAIPTTVVINKAGKIVFRLEGSADYNNEQFVSMMRKLSAEKI